VDYGQLGYYGYDYLINLLECKNKNNQIIKDFEQYKEIQLNFIEGFRNYNGKIRCFLSFKKCVRIAKKKDMKYIIILEYDYLPMNNFENRQKNNK